MPNRVECGSFNLKGETPKHPAIEYKLTTGKGANDQICGVIEFQFAASTPAPIFMVEESIKYVFSILLKVSIYL